MGSLSGGRWTVAASLDMIVSVYFSGIPKASLALRFLMRSIYILRDVSSFAHFATDTAG
jgi:hypothetical protein